MLRVHMTNTDIDIDSEATTESTVSATETDDDTFEDVCAQLNKLSDRVAELEAELERKDDQIDELESTVDRQDALLEALRRKAGGTREMVTELQSRELEKHAHLRWDNVDPNVDDLAIDADHVEKFTKDDGETYARPIRSSPRLPTGTASEGGSSDLAAWTHRD